MRRVYITNSVFISGGALVALVAISSCANHVNYWAAFLIGCLAGKKWYIFSRIRMFQNQNVLIHKCSTVHRSLASFLVYKKCPSYNGKKLLFFTIFDVISFKPKHSLMFATKVLRKLIILGWDSFFWKCLKVSMSSRICDTGSAMADG